MFPKKNIRPRIVGWIILFKAILPLILVFLFILVTAKSFSPSANKNLISIINYEEMALNDKLAKIQLQIDQLSSNFNNTVSQLYLIRDQLEAYKSDKTKEAKQFWDDIESILIKNKKRLEDYKALIVSELDKYINIIYKKIDEVKAYIKDMLAFKDDLKKFISDLKKELEPLNDIIDFLESLDVLGVFDVKVFSFPNFPKLPKFPSIDWQSLIPDYSVIVDEAIKIKDGVIENIENTTQAAKKLLTPPDLTDLRNVFNYTELNKNYIVPIKNIGSELQYYLDHFNDTKIAFDNEILRRKAALSPYVRLIKIIIYVWILFVFISYLFKLKSRLKLSFALITGKRIDFDLQEL